MKEQARAKARQLAQEFAQRGDATGWFEELYAQAQGNQQAIHWADLAVNPNLVEWLDRRNIGGTGKHALVVGCGLGDDAEELVRRGFEVVAFDIAPTAIAWCRQRFPQSSVEYVMAEELFASGCQLLISITSAGQILPVGQPPYVILIEQALVDEGASYHYLPPAPYSHLDPALREMVSAHWDHGLYVGASWTTDAPFQETEALIAQRRAEGIPVVEMEAAALYALASARQYQIICFAHVTNQMGQTEGDFEKGAASASETALSVVRQTAHAWRQRNREPTQPF